MKNSRFGWKRWWGSGPRPFTADGKQCCKMCPNAVSERRKEYCGEACAVDYRVRTSGSSARFHVGKRDKGVCSQCGLDTARINRILERARNRARIGRNMRWSHDEEGSLKRAASRLISLLERMRSRGFKVSIFENREWGTWSHLWEADHILPVVEDGGGCGLDNLRTLCIPCHRKATAELATRRAKGRRAAQPQRS